MRRLVTALLPSEVEVDGHLYLVRRPTVGEALSVFALVDEGASAERLRIVVDSWLPDGLMESLLRRADPVKTIVELLQSGMPEKQKNEAKRVNEKAADVSWVHIVATYARAFDMAPSAVLQEPWALFVTMVAEIDRLEAKDQLTNASWYAGAKVGKLDSIVERAGGGRPQMPDEPEYMSDPEWLARQRGVIRNLRQKQAEA